MSRSVRLFAVPVVILALALAVWLLRPLFVDSVVDEGFPMSAGAEVPEGMTQAQVESEMTAAAAADGVEVVEEMPDAEPSVLVSGSFTGADGSHEGSGSATVYALADGRTLLRLEDFEVTNGPQLHVLLAPLGPDDAPDIDAAVDLGPLKGNIGDQNYDVPGQVDPDQPFAVVIYCVPFRVTFATATLG